MADSALLRRLHESFPFLSAAPPALGERLVATGTRVSLAAGHHVCHEGNPCAHLPMVLAGTARVYKLGETGREITLYRVEAGQTCILTASCILSDRRFPAFASCETDVEALAIPAAAVRDWLVTSAEWRGFIFGLVALRLAGVISVVEEVAFRRMDRRVAEYLARGLPSTVVIATTHQQMAYDLGTSREVVTRILKELEQRGLVAVARGRIEVLDPAGLRQAATAV
jgi:CRP/FNR family transcriptional regulator